MQDPKEEIVAQLKKENIRLENELLKRKNEYEALLQKKQKTDEKSKDLEQKIMSVYHNYNALKLKCEQGQDQNTNLTSTLNQKNSLISDLQNKVKELQGKLAINPLSKTPKQVYLACLEQLESVPELSGNAYLELFKKMVGNISFSDSALNTVVKGIKDIEVLKLLVRNGLELSPNNMPDFIPPKMISNSLEFAVMIGDQELTENLMEKDVHRNIHQALYLAIVKKRVPIINILINNACTNVTHAMPYSGFDLIKNIINGLNDSDLQKTAIITLLDLDKFLLKDHEFNQLIIMAGNNRELVTLMHSSRFFKFRYQQNFTESLLNLSDEEDSNQKRPTL